MRFAIILYNKAHQIIEADIIPNFPPTPRGNTVVVVDITNRQEVQEGWDYDVNTDTFSPPIIPKSVEYSFYAIQDEYGYITDIRLIPDGEDLPVNGKKVPSYDMRLIGEICINDEIITKRRIWEALVEIDRKLDLLLRPGSGSIALR